jgi:hypothetical protein
MQIIDMANAGLTTVPDSDRTGVPATLVAKGDKADPARASLIVSMRLVEQIMWAGVLFFPKKQATGLKCSVLNMD